MADAKVIEPSTADAATAMCLGYELFVGLVRFLLLLFWLVVVFGWFIDIGYIITTDVSPFLLFVICCSLSCVWFVFQSKFFPQI